MMPDLLVAYRASKDIAVQVLVDASMDRWHKQFSATEVSYAELNEGEAADVSLDFIKERLRGTTSALPQALAAWRTRVLIGRPT